jgi:nucleotide-binding universal stress UspA family protein
MKVLAALDNSSAAKPVLATAVALAELYDASLEALHVYADGDRVAAAAATTAGVPLHEVRGVPVEQLIDAAKRDDVAALVLGARGGRFGKRPLGSTAVAVATEVAKPVAIVPPDTAEPGRLHRVLVPLEGTVSTSLAPRSVIELARDAHLEVVVLHVLEEDSLPSFTDQPQHEESAWADEFLARHCPWGMEAATLETRVGRREEVVPAVAAEIAADLIALGWTRQLEPGRAPVVQAALARTVPVVLIPVEVSASLSRKVLTRTPARTA